MAGVITTLILFGLFPGIILGFILLSRYLKYRETKLMLEHGITPPQHLPPPPVQMPQMMPPPLYARAPMPMPAPPRPAPRRSRAQLTWGLVLSAIGLALSLGLWPIGLIANSATGDSGPKFPLGLGPWMLGGFIPLFVGLALILGHVASQHDRPATPQPVYPPAAGRGLHGPFAAPPTLSLTEEMLLRPDPLAMPSREPAPPVAEKSPPDSPAKDAPTPQPPP